MLENERITPEELDAIEVRARAATPGKWVTDDYAAMVRAENPYSHGDMHVADIRGWGHLTGLGACAMSEEKAFEIQLANAAFIAAARTDVPALVNEVRRLTEIVSAMESDNVNAEMNLEHITAENKALKARLRDAETFCAIHGMYGKIEGGRAR